MLRINHTFACAITAIALSLGATACADETTSTDPGTTPTPTTGPTYWGHVQPILENNCSSCHTDGGVGPFGLTTYESAKALSGLIASATHARTMPPWNAHDTDECKPRLPWKDDMRLSQEQLDTLQQWHDNGAPEGDPSEAPAPAEKADGNDAINPFELPNRTHSLVPLEPFTTEGTSDDFVCQVLDPQLDKDMWLTGIQVMPGNALVTHHAVIYVDFDGDTARELGGENGQYPCFGGPGDVNGALVSAWAPGGLPIEFPARSGMQIPKEAVFVVQMHYHPTGISPETDLTSIDLRMTDETPEFRAATALIGNNDDMNSNGEGLQPGPGDSTSEPEFVIPANATDHTETQVFYVPPTLDNEPYPGAFIWGVATHMHYVGTDMKIDVERVPDQQPPSCPATETTALYACGDTHCSDAADLLSCVLANCADEFDATGQTCIDCLLANAADESAVEICSTDGWAPHPAYGDVADQPAEECLVQTPDWNFEWQRMYSYDAPIEQLPFVGAGDKVTMRCTYNNSLGNPWVAEALQTEGLTEPHDVVLGDETLDEMCLWAVVYLYKNYTDQLPQQ